MMKGQIYFNWIFVVVIGAVMLTFFVGFAVKYKDLQEKKTEVVFLNNLDNALTNLQSSSFTTSTNIDLPLDININCSSAGYSLFIHQKNDVSYLLASKNKLRNKLYIWYEPYEMPFFVTNFYYLIDDRTNIRINSNFYNEIIGSMPDSFKQRVSSDPNGILIQGNVNEGTVNGNRYTGREMLYAAIFSENYNCFYEIVRREFNKAIIIYQNKASLLSKGGCNYNRILSELNNLQNNFNYQTINNIEQMNRDLATANCPVLY